MTDEQFQKISDEWANIAYHLEFVLESMQEMNKLMEEELDES